MLLRLLFLFLISLDVPFFCSLGKLFPMANMRQLPVQ